MCHPGDRLPLLAGGGGHQRTRCQKQHVTVFPALHGREKVGTHHGSAAPAPRSPGIHLLTFPVVQHQAAVGVAGAQVAALPGGQAYQQIAAHLCQIPGDDLIVIGGGGAGIGKKAAQGIPCGGRHGCPHIIRVGDAEIHHTADADLPDADFTEGGDQRSPGGGGGMLGGRCSYPAVVEGEAELPFAGAKVGGGHGEGVAGGAAFHQQGGQGQAFGHGATRPVKPQEGAGQLPGGVGGGDALIEQVAAEEDVHPVGGDLCLLQGDGDGQLLHFGFGLFPAFFTEAAVLYRLVEFRAEGAFFFLAAADGCGRCYFYRGFQPDGTGADAFCHWGLLGGDFWGGGDRGAAPPAAGGRHELRSCVSASPKRAAPEFRGFCELAGGKGRGGRGMRLLRLGGEGWAGRRRGRRRRPRRAQPDAFDAVERRRHPVPAPCAGQPGAKITSTSPYRILAAVP